MSFLDSFQLPSIFFQNPYVATCFPIAVGSAIGFFTAAETKNQYGTLRQPPLKPPAWLFGPVWTTLYAGMGIASYLARHDSKARGLYTLSLVLNFAWMPMFFGYAQRSLALADIVALWGTLLTLQGHWQQADDRAGLVGWANLAWVSFATYLNAGLVYLN
ncbi:benzodiazepine receptor family protein [Protomyces lactucae-debilis]|uniref:Benzodiazepine receptor family protein n=1 Tax=Protomyces lactucae-debilis TaxID=2754530 RepID=A0A1Y2FLK1_PROLT|nr:benzodiazepine receptor family protein [Protomyces lactucae-debilis]ORY84838.1 benzodiazepine receptor family protein [Protomyces lactucae-debilis]